MTIDKLQRWEPDIDYAWSYHGCSCCPPQSTPVPKMVKEELGGWVRWADIIELIKHMQRDLPDGQ